MIAKRKEAKLIWRAMSLLLMLTSKSQVQHWRIWKNNLRRKKLSWRVSSKPAFTCPSYVPFTALERKLKDGFEHGTLQEALKEATDEFSHRKEWMNFSLCWYVYADVICLSVWQELCSVLAQSTSLFSKLASKKSLVLYVTVISAIRRWLFSRNTYVSSLTNGFVGSAHAF